MKLTAAFDLTPAQVQEGLPANATGLFAGLKRKILDKAIAQVAPRLAGPTTVELSEAGVRVTTGGGTQERTWAEAAAVNERPQAWAVQYRPNGVSFVPASAVAPDERAAFSEQLRAWAGARYRVREGAWPRAPPSRAETGTVVPGENAEAPSRR